MYLGGSDLREFVCDLSTSHNYPCSPCLDLIADLKSMIILVGSRVLTRDYFAISEADLQSILESTLTLARNAG